MAITSRGLRTGQVGTRSGDDNDLCADKPVFCAAALCEDHGNNFLEIAVELVERCALAMGAWKARDVTDIQACVRTVFDHSCESPHRCPHDDIQ